MKTKILCTAALALSAVFRRATRAALWLPLVAASVWSAPPATADTVTLDFTGTVTFVDPDVLALVGATVSLGDRLSGSYTYDLHSAGTVNGGSGDVVTLMQYATPVPPGAMSYHVGSLSVTTAIGESVLTLVGNGTRANMDPYGPAPYVDSFVGSADTASPSKLESNFQLEDTTGTVYSDTSLPASVDVHAFSHRRFRVALVVGDVGYPVLTASVDTISVAPTPLESGLWYVANNGSDSASCGAYATPCRSISKAIALANEGDQVMVGPGRYGDLNGDGDFADPGDEAATFDGYWCMICVNKGLRIFASAGASATVLDASSALAPVHPVVLNGNHITFQGFTMLRAWGDGLLVTSNAANVQVLENVAMESSARLSPALEPAAGFAVFSGRGRVTMSRNVSIGNDVGYRLETGGVSGYIIATDNKAYQNRDEGFRATNAGEGRAIALRNNEAIGNTVGFDVAGILATLESNRATANHSHGFLVGGSAHRIVNPIATMNRGAGIFFNATAEDLSIREGIIYGNEGESSSHGHNCGVVNDSLVAGNSIEVAAFFGSSSGPGDDPADAAALRSGCDLHFPESTTTIIVLPAPRVRP